MSLRKNDKSPVIPKIIHKTYDQGSSLSHSPVDSYKIEDMLGKGGFGICYRATQISNSNKVAVKMISKTADSMRKAGALNRLTNQIEIMKKMNHPNINQIFDSFQDVNYYYLILELCEKNSLTKMLKERQFLTEPEVKYFIRQLIEAVIYVKSKKVIHRDIKGCNLLLDKNLTLKLADFGLATYQNINGPNRNNTCGTPNYMAPEIVKKIKYSYQVDDWATGIVTYASLFGKPPFADPDNKAIYKKIQSLDYSFPSQKKISREAEDFIRRLLIVDPVARMKPHEAINHPFLTEKVPKNLPSSCCSRPPPKNIEKVRFQLKITESNNKNKQVQIIDDMQKQPQQHIQQTMKKTSGKSRGKKQKIVIKKTVEMGKNHRIQKYFSPIPNRDIYLVEEEKKPDNFDNPPNQMQKDEKNIIDEVENPQEEVMSEQVKEKQTRNIQLQKVVQEKPLWQWLKQNLQGHPFVIDFLDQGSKFGFCYMLSSKVRGISFNDNSTITIDETNNQIMYFRHNQNYERIIKQLEIQLPFQNQIKPIFTNSTHSQYIVPLSQVHMLRNQAVNKYKVLEEYSMKCPFQMPGHHGTVIKVQVQQNNPHNCVSQDQRKSITAKGTNNSEEYLYRIKYECLKHWAVARKSGKLSYLTVLNDLVQIFFEDGSKFYIKKHPLKILFVMGQERRIFTQSFKVQEESEAMRVRFEMLQYFLKYLLRKQRKMRNS